MLRISKQTIALTVVAISLLAAVLGCTFLGGGVTEDTVPVEPGSEAEEVPAVPVVEETAPAEPAVEEVQPAESEVWVFVDWTPETRIDSATVSWVDMGTGETSTVSAAGSIHRMGGEWVYYQGPMSIEPVSRVNAAGGNETLDFMEVPEGYMDMVWAVSADGTRIAWSQAFYDMTALTMETQIYVVDTTTGETRLLLTQTESEPMTFPAPWGFSQDGSQLYLYETPWGIGGYILFRLYGQFSVMDVATGEVTMLTDPVDTFSPATLSDDGTRLARIQRSDEELVIYVTDLTSGGTIDVAAVPEGYNRAGNIVFLPGNERVVYTAAVAEGPGGPEQEMFALLEVDLTTGAQAVLIDNQPVQYEIVRVEEDGSLLMTMGWEPGTARLHPDGTVEHVSDSTYLGVAP